MTEYVLLMVITVSLILALANQMYKPFNKWLNSYMGDYLQCLLDAGELPALGYQGDEGSLCPTKGFDWGDGFGTPATYRPNRLADNKNSSGAKKSPGGGGNSSSSGSGGGSRGAASSSSDGMRVRNSKGMGVEGGSEGQGKKVTVENPEPSKGYLKVSGGVAYSSDSNRSSVEANGLAGLLETERKKAKERENKTIKVGEVEGESLGKPNRLRIKNSERKVASEVAEDSWNFGQIMKWAVILMLIIAILLFLVGQAMQISKSMEK